MAIIKKQLKRAEGTLEVNFQLCGKCVRELAKSSIVNRVTHGASPPRV